MRVLILAEYYPRASDPTLGIWAHRQAVAARDAGAEVRVLVLHRPIPSAAALRNRDRASIRTSIAQPAQATLDGIRIDYLRYLSPPRPLSYARWGAWAAPRLRRALPAIRREFAFDLIHAHYAVPAGDAVRRAAPTAPLIVSVHGGDVLGPHAGTPSVRAALSHAQLVLANSRGTALRCEQRGGRAVRVVHLGAAVPEAPSPPPPTPTLVTVGNLIARKRQGDVIEALSRLHDRHPQLQTVLVGDGPDRPALTELAAARGVADRVTFAGRLAPEDAVAAGRHATLMVLPSVEEAFGVAYVEAMAAGVPAIGCRGQDGPQEIIDAGGGMELVTPGDPGELADLIDALLTDPQRLQALRVAARATVQRAFTWERCGAETVAAYEEVARG